MVRDWLMVGDVIVGDVVVCTRREAGEDDDATEETDEP